MRVPAFVSIAILSGTLAHARPTLDAERLGRLGSYEVLTFGDPTITGAAIEPDVPHAHAKWRGHTLVSERAGPRGKITRTFELTKDGKQLIITTHREGSDGRPPLDFKRVYDHYTGD